MKIIIFVLMKHKNKIKKNKPKTKHEGKNEENGKNRSQRMVEKKYKNI